MYACARVRAACAVPTEHTAILMRPPSMPFMAMAKPSPSAPSRLAAGTFTWSKLMMRVGWLFQPIFSSFLPYTIPGKFAGTAKAEMPAAPSPPVRAMTISMSVWPAPEINAFVPSST